MIVVQTSLVLKLSTHQHGNTANRFRQGETGATGGFAPARSLANGHRFHIASFPNMTDGSLFAAGILLCVGFLFVGFLSPCRSPQQGAATLCNFADNTFGNLCTDVTCRARAAAAAQQIWSPAGNPHSPQSLTPDNAKTRTFLPQKMSQNQPKNAPKCPRLLLVFLSLSSCRQVPLRPTRAPALRAYFSRVACGPASRTSRGVLQPHGIRQQKRCFTQR